MVFMERGHEDPTDRVVILKTPRLVLTTWDSSDVDSLLEVHSDPEAMRHVRFGRPETRSEVEELIEAYLSAQKARGWTKWRLADLEGELVGRAGFGGDDNMRGIAYAIRRSHWGRGLATEVVVHIRPGCGPQLARNGRGPSAQRLAEVPGFEPFGGECLGFKSQSGQTMKQFLSVQVRAGMSRVQPQPSLRVRVGGVQSCRTGGSAHYELHGKQ